MGRVSSLDLGHLSLILGSVDTPELDFGRQNGLIFDVCRHSSTFGAKFLRTQQNTIKNDARSTSELSHDKTKGFEKQPKIDPRARSRSVQHWRSDGAPEGSWSVFGAAQGRFWTAPGRSWLARGAPRSALGWHLGVQKPSQACPDASPKRLWAPKTAQD